MKKKLKTINLIKIKKCIFLSCVLTQVKTFATSTSCFHSAALDLDLALN